MSRKIFELKVTKIESICIFELSWEADKNITVNLQYPESLNNYYEEWKKAYLLYYRDLRGRKAASGKGNLKIDYRSQLVNAQSKLLDEFHHWLFSPELIEIRREIANSIDKYSNNFQEWTEVFLTCTPIEISRLPWETWEIGTDLGAAKRIRIARKPASIRNHSITPLRRKARILAILGDDTGLNFESEKEELKKINSNAYIEFIGWTPQKNIDELKQEIVRNIASVNGWDILFFAGHSNESVLTGGEVGIAPKTSIFISEIKDALILAKKRGLQFAIFNSCSGINIAESLINIGLSQVVVMREPINNKVAQEFFKQFLESLANYKDVHESLLDATKFLKQQEKRISYPSTYLIPSLFRHPGAELFRIKPFGLWSIIKQYVPTLKETMFLAAFLIISLSLQQAAPNLLLEPRLFLQAIYRKITFQVPDKFKSLVVVKIDNKSLQIARREKKLQSRYPLDYGYLALIIQKLSSLNSNIIGIDYILNETDFQPTKVTLINKTIRDSVKNNNTTFVFASAKYQDENRGRVSDNIASLKWSLQGHIHFFEWYVELPSVSSYCYRECPFGYLLALSYSMQKSNVPDFNLPPPSLKSEGDFRNRIVDKLTSKENIQDKQINYLYHLRYENNWLNSNWFHPIIDFSIPPNKLYQSISACDLTSNTCKSNRIPKNLKNKIVFIIPGGYEEAGIDTEGEDNSSIPLAVAFWSGWGDGEFPKSEAHAYMIHHLLTKRLVIPIPDILIVVIAALLAKSIGIVILDNPERQKKFLNKLVLFRQKLFPELQNINEQQLVIIGLGIATTSYVIISFQLFIAPGILLPCFLPSVIFWAYIRLKLNRKYYRRNSRE